MNKKGIIGFIIVTLIGLGVWYYLNGNTEVTAEKEVVKIGVILPLTGDAASYGKSLKKGLDLTKQRNIQFIYEDSKAEPKTAVNSVNKLINFDKVDLIIGDMFTHTTMAINPIVDKNKTLLITPTASASTITETSNYTFRLYSSEKEEAQVLVDFYKSKLNNQSAIFVANEDAMLKVSDILSSQIQTKMTNKFEYQKGIKDFKTQLSRINKDVKTIFILGYLEESVLLIRQAKEIGINADFIGLSTLFNPTLGDLIKGVENNIYVPTPYYRENMQDSVYLQFYNHYFKVYNEKPDVWAAYGYDAGNIAELIIKKSKENITNYIEEMYKISNFKGVTGEITINPDRSIKKQMQIKIYRNNKFEDVN